MIEKSELRGVRFGDSLKSPLMTGVFGEAAMTKYSRILLGMLKLFHIPYVPPIRQHGKTGWLMSYFRGEVPFEPISNDTKRYGGEWCEALTADIIAGITIGLTLIPQALSYATLANLPAINGLYSNIFPAAVYATFGTSNCLAVGPVAIVSLLVGAIINKYIPNPLQNPQDAVDLAAEASLCVGILLAGMGVLNLGRFIRFLSHPVISGFTSAAASLIGLSQLKSAFGFPNVVPQIGSHTGVEYNYEQMAWYVANWNGKTIATAKTPSIFYRNHFAVKICFAIYIPLVIVATIKGNLKISPETRKKRWFKCWSLFTSILPLVAIIVGAHVAYTIMTTNNSHYAQTLKIVGPLVPGIDIIRFPKMRYPLGQLFVDVIPVTIIGFMESYSVSRKLASGRNELEQLDASQELFAIGVGNMFGSFTSAYPVCGSYSRTSLAGSSGAKTPLTQIITLAVVLLSLGTLTTTFFYIPTAALAGIIFTAVTNLISPSDFIEAWIHSKNDFFTMLVTFTITFVFDTGLGLAAGVGTSVIMLLKDIVFAPDSKPFFEIIPSVASIDDIAELVDDDDEEQNYTDCLRGKGMADLTVQIVRLNNDLVFLTAPMIKDTLVDEIINKRGNKFKALIIDFTDVKLVDISGMMALSECASHTRAKKLRFVLVNVRSTIHLKLVKFGINSDEICLDRINMASTGDLSASILRVPNDKYFSGIIHDENLCLLGSDPEANLVGLDIDNLENIGSIDIDDESGLCVSDRSINMNSKSISTREKDQKLDLLVSKREKDQQADHLNKTEEMKENH